MSSITGSETGTTAGTRTSAILQQHHSSRTSETFSGSTQRVHTVRVEVRAVEEANWNGNKAAKLVLQIFHPKEDTAFNQSQQRKNEIIRAAEDAARKAIGHDVKVVGLTLRRGSFYGDFYFGFGDFGNFWRFMEALRRAAEDIGSAVREVMEKLDTDEELSPETKATYIATGAGMVVAGTALIAAAPVAAVAALGVGAFTVIRSLFRR